MQRLRIEEILKSFRWNELTVFILLVELVICFVLLFCLSLS